jgi:hypothetical protein
MRRISYQRAARSEQLPPVAHSGARRSACSVHTPQKLSTNTLIPKHFVGQPILAVLVGLRATKGDENLARVHFSLRYMDAATCEQVARLEEPRARFSTVQLPFSGTTRPRRDAMNH